MTRLRILAALSAVVLALGVLPASAQEELEDALDDGTDDGVEDGDGEAEEEDAGLLEDAGEGPQFIATGDGGGFDVQIAEERLTVGLSEVGIQSSTDGAACEDTLACATAAGETLLGETAEVGVTEASASDEATAFDLNELEPLAAGGIGTATVDASVEGGVTSANAQGGALDLEVSLAEELLDESTLSLLEDLLGGGDSELNQEQLDELVSELEGVLDLDADEISETLEDAGLAAGAQTQSGQGSTMATPDQVAQDLVDAHQAQQEEEEDPLEGDGDQDNPLEDDGGDNGGDGGGDGGDGGGGGGGDGEDPDPDAIAELIEGVVGGDDGGGDQPEGPEELLQAIEDLLEDPTAQPLVRTALAPTSSAAEDADGVTSASANAQGLQLVVLPTADSTLDNPDGLVSLQVGAASASVSSDRSDPNADFDPALARLRVTDPLTGEVEEVTVEPGESDCAGEEPLLICVTVGDGDTTVADGGASASANAVSVTALGDPLPQVSIDLAAATAAVNADAAVEEAEADGDEEVEPAEELPVTGGGFLLPGLFLLGAGAAGFVGRRRLT